jgi:HAD superfamily hydrolase (TIGR01549 family)
MIRAMIFDLDGTLVQTERLKALSYARAAVELCPYTLSEAEAVEAFKDVVGLSRREVAQALVERFDLGEKARSHMAEFGVSAPWQAFVQVRLCHYEKMLADPQVLRSNQWPHNVALLNEARRSGCKTALATMSRCEQARRVLEVLDLADAFDFVATRDDVEHGKPDPEIYQLVARELGVPPTECLVIEDSPSGVKAALAAGMWCIAVTTPFTRQRIHAERLLHKRWVADDPATLTAVVQRMVAACTATVVNENRTEEQKE